MLSFALNVLVARLLGAEGAGVFFLALTLITVAAAVGHLGLPNALLRFSASGAASGDWTEVKGVYRKGVGLALAGGVAATVLLVLAAGFLESVIFRMPGLAGVVRVMALAVVPTVLIILHEQVLKGIKRILFSQLVHGLTVPGLALVGVYVLAREGAVLGAAEDVALFHTANRTAYMTTLVLVSVNSIAAPKFAELYRMGDHEALRTTAQRSAWLMTLLAGPVLLAFVIAPATVMSLFGPHFVAAADLLVILAIGQFVNVASGSVGFLLMMSGNERLVRNNTAAFAVVNVALNLVLVPTLGRVGAAIATSVSLGGLNLSGAYLVGTRLGIRMLPFFPGRTGDRGRSPG